MSLLIFVLAYLVLIIKTMIFSLLRFISRKKLSYLVGKIAAHKFSPFFSKLYIPIFARIIKANRDEMIKPIDEYYSFSNFFKREIDLSKRPIQMDSDSVVSPADGKHIVTQKIENDKNFLIKNTNISIKEIFEGGEFSEDIQGEYQFYKNFTLIYLSPSDYHRVHSPFDFEVHRVRLIAGDLWPVNDWSLNNISNVFGVNERLVISGINLATGKKASLIMIGATNVGKILFCEDSSNEKLAQELVLSSAGVASASLLEHGKSYDISITNNRLCFKKGELISGFDLGSSVILLTEGELFDCNEVGQVKVGEKIYRVV